jgi:aspartate-semialdehyde dehydrogenase
MPDERVHPPKLAIVGAGGTVGGQIRELISSRGFVFDQLKLYGSEPGEAIEDDETNGTAVRIAALKSADELAGFDVVFLATPIAAADAIAKARPGPLLIDLSRASQLPSSEAPLAAPGLTSRERLLEYKRIGRIGVPHPAAQVIASVLQALDLREGFAGALILLGASSRGRDAITGLLSQSTDLLNARLDLEEDETQTAFNVLVPPYADVLAEAVNDQAVALNSGPVATAVQTVYVPAFHGAGVGLFLPTSGDANSWKTRLRATPGIILVEGAESSSFVDAIGQEAVITRMTLNAAGAALWCVFDAARIAALTAVWIAENLRS